MQKIDQKSRNTIEENVEICQKLLKVVLKWGKKNMIEMCKKCEQLIRNYKKHEK